MVSDVGTCTDVEQRIGRCGGLCIIGCIIMILTQIAFHSHFDKHIVKSLAVADDVITQIGRPSGWRCHRQIFALFRLMQLNGVDIRE